MIADQYANLFDCKVSELPMNYLGVPVSPCRLHVDDWTKLVEKVDKRLQNWKGSVLSIPGELPLLMIVFLMLQFTICPCTFCPKP